MSKTLISETNRLSVSIYTTSGTFTWNTFSLNDYYYFLIITIDINITQMASTELIGTIGASTSYTNSWWNLQLQGNRTGNISYNVVFTSLHGNVYQSVWNYNPSGNNIATMKVIGAGTSANTAAVINNSTLRSFLSISSLNAFAGDIKLYLYGIK